MRHIAPLSETVPYDMLCESDCMIEMRDGIRLSTDLYFPSRWGERVPGHFPVILERTPYGKSHPSRSELANDQDLQGSSGDRGKAMSRMEVAAFFVARGYVVIYQDVRGRNNSEGAFVKYLSEANDGFDTCAWTVRQPWCNGRIATKGLSYAAHTQMALACVAAPGLAAMVVDSGGFSNGYTAGIRQGGAYEMKQAAWAVMFAMEDARRRGMPKTITSDELSEWFSRTPWKRGASPLSATPDYEDFLFDQWERGNFDDYWRQPGIFAEGFYPRMADVAAMHISSWYDVYSRTATENYRGMLNHGAPTRLILGPWTHGDRSQTWAGDVEFGPTARFDVGLGETFLEMRLRWFDHWLKSIPNGVANVPPVMIFVMGGGSGRKNAEGRMDHGGRWRAEQAWPIPDCATERLYLHASGMLAAEPPSVEEAFRDYRFDPARPVPTLGGAVVQRPPSILAGPFNQVESAAFFGCVSPFGPLSARGDVLVFQTEPLEVDMEVTGDITVLLWVSSDAPDTDFTIKLIDVVPPNEDYPEGYAMNLTDGILRARYRSSWESPSTLTPGHVYRLCIQAPPVSNLFKAGHRIRLDISSSNYPRFDINPNTGAPEASSTESRVATNRIYMDALHLSQLHLPVVHRSPSNVS
jgi:putative CocE/NonD family hydrolase